MSSESAASHPSLGSAAQLASGIQSRDASLHGTNPLTRILASWHLLSLDAPTVASLWVLFIARSSHIFLPWAVPAAIFIAVWLLYVADRLLDARDLRTGIDMQTLEKRHRFHWEHRRIFVAVAVLCLPVLVLLLRQGDPAALRLHLLLGALLAIWLVIIHLRSADRRLPKELAVGIFFPAAIFIPTVGRVPALRPLLLPDALLLAVICSLNCLYIYAWEHPYDQTHAHATTRWAIRRLRPLTFGAFLAACVLACAQASLLSGSLKTLVLPATACAFSAFLFQVLHQNRTSLLPVTLRAAADIVLLTPIPLLLLPAMFHR